MANARSLLLIAVAVALAGLLFWDRRNAGEGVVTAVSRQAQEGSGGPATPDASGDGTAQAPQDELMPALTGNPLASLNLKSLDATRSRPLFTPSRKAPAPPPKAAEAPAPEQEAPQKPAAPKAEPGQFVLMGVVAGEAESIALLRYKKTGEMLRMRKGDVFDGWQLEEVEADRVVLRKDEAEEELVLFDEDDKS
jgi:general secretion pathway protein N